MQKKIKDSLFNQLIMCNLKVIKLKNNTSPFGCTRLSFMSTKITKTGITSNKISGRGGLPLFPRYAEQIGLYGLITGHISSQVSGNRKGLQLQLFIKQIIAFFIDGTNMAISSFDQSKKDEGYASLLECTTDQMASSHQIKRFFGKLSCITGFVFNMILNELFIWRLNISIVCQQAKILV